MDLLLDDLVISTRHNDMALDKDKAHAREIIIFQAHTRTASAASPSDFGREDLNGRSILPLLSKWTGPPGINDRPLRIFGNRQGSEEGFSSGSIRYN